MGARGPAAPLAPQSDASTRLIRTLAVTVFLEWLGATSIVPMLPVYIRHLGGTDLLAGLVMASFFVAGVLFQYPLGRLADRVGRKPVLIGGLVVYGLASFAFLAPIVPAMAIVLRGLQGLGAGASAIAALAMVSGAVAVERRGRAFASIYGAQISGMAVGPLIGAIVGAHHMWIMFLGSGVVAFIACVPALRIVEPPEEAARRDARTNADGTRRQAGPRAVEPLHVRGHDRRGRPRAHHRRLRHLLDAAAGVPRRGRLADRHLVDALLGAVRGRRPTQRMAGRPHGPSLPGPRRASAWPWPSAPPTRSSARSPCSSSSAPPRRWGSPPPCRPSSHSSPRAPTRPRSAGSRACSAPPRRHAPRLAAAAAGAAFAVARWLPFVSAAAITAVALVATAIVWRTVAGHVHPERVIVEAGGAAGDGSTELPAPGGPGAGTTSWPLSRRWASASRCSRRSGWPGPAPWTGTRGTRAWAPRSGSVPTWPSAR